MKGLQNLLYDCRNWEFWHVYDLSCNVPCAETEHSTSQPETNYLVAAKRISMAELYF